MKSLAIFLTSLLVASSVADAQDVFIVPDKDAPVAKPKAGEAYPPGTELYVTATALALRKQPSAEAERIHFIPEGEKVVVQPDGTPPLPVSFDGIKGHWLKVKQGYHTGYVFDGYLSPTPSAAPTAPAPEEGAALCVPGDHVGPINANTSVADLVAQFGADQVKETEIALGEGFFEPGTVVFPGTPKELKIRWADYGEKPASVIIDQEGSPWKTPKGIGIGTTLETLEQINGKPFSLLGFNWDYSGGITNWNGGALEKDHAIGTAINLTLYPRDPDAQVPPALIGDNEASSTLGAGLGIRVIKMVVQVAPAETEPQAASAALYPAGTPLWIYASELNVRAEPNASAGIVTRLPYGTAVTAKAMDSMAEGAAENMRGYWVAISSSTGDGYVFSPFVLPVPAPAAGVHSVQDYYQANQSALGGGTNPTAAANLTDGGDKVTLTIDNISIEQAFVFAKNIGAGLDKTGYIKPTRGVIAMKQSDGRFIHVREGVGCVHIDFFK